MPELPEVETTRQGIAPHIVNRTVTDVVIRIAKLRWPVAPHLSSSLQQSVVQSVDRRGKYLLLKFPHGTLIIHLGMSGSLRICPKNKEIRPHEHISIEFSEIALRYRDPRKFGAVIWTTKDPLQHKLLCQLGPEPLSNEFNGKYLHQQSRNRRVTIKEFIMNSRVVVGVGNIYASEALYKAGIHPCRAAGKTSLKRYELLCHSIKSVLQSAIQKGGTTLRDFAKEDGNPGYFKQELQAYGRAGLECNCCGKTLKSIRIGQRSSVYCGHCQR